MVMMSSAVIIASTCGTGSDAEKTNERAEFFRYSIRSRRS